MNGDSEASSPAATSQIAPIAPALQPAAARCRGASTESTPNIIEATASSTRPLVKRRALSALRSVTSTGSATDSVSICTVSTASATASPASRLNTVPRPAAPAATPMTGPNSSPATAAPMARPITWPR